MQLKFNNEIHVMNGSDELGGLIDNDISHR